VLSLKPSDRVRVLAAVARAGPRFQAARIAVITASLAILLAVPLLGIVRIDMFRQHHVLLRSRVGLVQALQGMVVVLAVLYGVTFLTNMVVGRFFCGWGCPVGYVSRLGEDVELGKGRRRRILGHLAGAGFVASFVLAIMLWWVDPAVLVEGSPAAKAATAIGFLSLWAGGFLHAFWWRFGFCRSACPIGLYYRFVTSRAPIGIAFSNVPDKCVECGACQKVCPVDLDPRNLGIEMPSQALSTDATHRYGDAECLRCGDCVEACRMIFHKAPGATPPLGFGRVTNGA
jgi:ferredoxin-type protein NapH